MKTRSTFLFLTALVSFMAWATFLQARPAVAAADDFAHAAFALGDNLSITGPGPGADGSSKASGTSYGNVLDGNTSTIWGATSTSNQNIAVKWSSAVTANTVIIREQGSNISSWRLETGDGLALASGTTIGAEKLIQFQTTTTVKLRLVILNARANPAISEFEVYNSSGSTPGTSYQLSTSVVGQGSVSPASGTFAEGEAVSLRATPASGWQFSGWSGAASGSSNPLTISMNSNKAVTATFVQSTSSCTNVVMQAEAGTISSGTIDTNHSGYTGTGFVNVTNAAGEWLQLSVNAGSAGNATVKVRYAAGSTDARPASVAVNGRQVLANLAMPATGSWSSWSEVSFTASLNAGANTIRLTALNAGGLPNIDKAEACVPGGTPTTYYTLSTTVSGQGSVSPANGSFKAGESVTLTATPASGWQFSGWSGAATGTSNPLSLSMNANKSITATFTQTSNPPTGVDFSQVGYSTLAGGTTGGAGGTSVTVSTGTDLQNAIKNKGTAPLTIYVQGVITPANSGALTKIDVKDVSDISILGAGAGAEFNGIGIKVTRASNIIIRNLKIHHVNIGDKDCISIEGPADHVWVDHCELYNEYQGVGKDYYDGLLDAKGAADYITFSWNYLHDSWKASLSGSSDSDTFGRRITYHHNFFENINSRLPLFRFGKGHVFNNYYKGVESSGINSRMGACVKIENNYFENVVNPWVTAYSSADGYGDVSGNQLVNSTFNYTSEVRQLPSCTASIPYAYTNVLHSAANVPSIVQANAGVGKINISPQSSARIAQAEQAQAKPLAQEAFNFYPNPVEGITTFEVFMNKAGKSKISLYSLQGALIQVVSDRHLDAGSHTIQYEHRGLKPGLYLYLLETEEGNVSKKVLVK